MDAQTISRNALQRPSGRATLAVAPDTSVVVGIDNYEEIVRAFGAASGEAVFESAALLIQSTLGTSAIPQRVKAFGGRRSFTGLACDLDFRSSFDTHNVASDVLEERLQARAALSPVAFDGHLIYPVFSVCSDQADAHGSGKWVGDFRPDCMNAQSKRIASEYRADMALAAHALGASATNHVFLTWQLASASELASASDDAGQILCHFALPQILCASGQRLSLAPAVGAMTRLGLIRTWDHKFVNATLARAEVQDGAGAVCVPISIESCRCDSWWSDLQCHLQQSGVLGHRLIFAINGRELRIGHEANSSAALSKFVGQARRLGIRFGVTGVGGGAADMETLFAVQPEFLSLDLRSVRHGLVAGDAVSVVRQFVGFASALGADVVAEGVDCAALVDLARSAGVRWQRGDAIALPSIYVSSMQCQSKNINWEMSS